MQNIAAWARRHPVLGYYILTFLISWGGVLILGSPYGMPTTFDKFQQVWPVVFLPYFFGPATAGLLMTALVDGRAGFRDLRMRFLKWGVSLRWYAVALLTAPLLVLLVEVPGALFTPDYVPAIVTSDNRPVLIIMGLVIGMVFGGLFEETGWTGFVVPKLRQRYGILGTGTIVGLLWGIWHILPGYWASGDASGAIILSAWLPPCVFFLGTLPAYRVLLVAVHDRTKSLPIVMLMHGALSASTLWILAPAVSGAALAIYYVILSAVIWAVVAWVVAAERRQARQPAPSAGPAD